MNLKPGPAFPRSGLIPKRKYLNSRALFTCTVHLRRKFTFIIFSRIIQGEVVAEYILNGMKQLWANQLGRDL
jgi:hypothetical protein